MADVTISVTVQKLSDSFQWFFSTPLATILPGSTSVEIQLVPNVGDTCVFQSGSNGQDPPLTFFTDASLTDTFVPEWFQNLDGVGTDTITFTDVNANQHERTYHLRINAVYNGTNTNSNDQFFEGLPVILNEGREVIDSPDPTIVNEGTDHPSVYSSQVNGGISHG